MTPEMSLKLGKALTYILKMEKTDSKRPRIVIGKDTRLSGYMFEQAMSAGIISMGADVLLVGPLPTPAISFLTVSMRADAGVVISASHNPFVDNGIKFFDRFGFKLPDKKELEIEELVLSDRINRLNVPPSDIGKAWRLDDAQGRYVVFVKNTFPKDLTLEGLKIILDCANGAAYKVSPIVFQELGAEVITIGVRPDGKNINTDCGSINPELLKRKVKDTGADLGIALDGDADRVIFCDEKGDEVDGDIVIAITADEMIRNNKLQKNTVVTTIMSNMSLETFIREKGGIVIRTPVGDRYVVEEMRIRGCNFGGEKSGHMIFLDHTTTGDGTLAALQLLAVMKRKEKKLSELAKIIDLYPQVLLNVKVREKKPFQDIPQLEDLLLLSEQRLKERGRINLRYSGTESLARIMVEGENEALVYEVAEEIAYRIQQAIGE
ncbi:MAG: phosphoglucosamine mutase [Candidatus Dadabacteria bacterium RBG_19FT_COMBO_40_33]|nr:MAG: phosphoglucosamine mutase [Candidatus Dadabacteria bacterium RBG_19FT_COMBO_40_33]